MATREFSVRIIFKIICSQAVESTVGWSDRELILRTPLSPSNLSGPEFFRLLYMPVRVLIAV